MPIHIQAKGFGIEIRKEKNLHMDGKYIIIEFEDSYPFHLASEYNWETEKIENEMDKALEEKLKANGYNCHVIWEDREVFLIENPSFSAKNAGQVILELFEGSKVIKQNFLTNFFR